MNLTFFIAVDVLIFLIGCQENHTNTSYNYLVPIPQEEMNKNKLLIKNPGYLTIKNLKVFRLDS